MRFAVLAAVAGLCASPALAQRAAIEPALSPEMAADAFGDAVTEACIPAVLREEGWDGLAAQVKAQFPASSSADARRQIGAADDETVFDAAQAKGVVFVRQKADRCTVSVYGPPAMATIVSLAQTLTGGDLAFERLAGAPPPNGFGQSLMKVENGKRVMIQLRGSEPGMPGHQSRFSVVTATVFAAPAG